MQSHHLEHPTEPTPPDSEPRHKIRMNESQKLEAYQNALTDLPYDMQIDKMNAIRSPKNLQRFLSAKAPADLVARFAGRVKEVAEGKLTQAELENIDSIQRGSDSNVNYYLDKLESDPPTLVGTDIAEIIDDIRHGHTRMHLLMGDIQLQNGKRAEAQDSFRMAIRAGHVNGYHALTTSFIEDEDLGGAMQLAIEALEKNYCLPALELAFHYYKNNNIKACKAMLRMIDDEDKRDPFKIMLEAAIYYGNFDRIEDLLQLHDCPPEDVGVLIAVSHLIEQDFERALKEIKQTFEEEGLTSLLNDIRKYEKEPNNYNLRVYVAKFARNILATYNMSKIGNRIVNDLSN